MKITFCLQTKMSDFAGKKIKTLSIFFCFLKTNSYNSNVLTTVSVFWSRSFFCLKQFFFFATPKVFTTILFYWTWLVLFFWLSNCETNFTPHQGSRKNKPSVNIKSFYLTFFKRWTYKAPRWPLCNTRHIKENCHSWKTLHQKGKNFFQNKQQKN